MPSGWKSTGSGMVSGAFVADAGEVNGTTRTHRAATRTAGRNRRMMPSLGGLRPPRPTFVPRLTDDNVRGSRSGPPLVREPNRVHPEAYDGRGPTAHHRRPGRRRD